MHQQRILLITLLLCFVGLQYSQQPLSAVYAQTNPQAGDFVLYFPLFTQTSDLSDLPTEPASNPVTTVVLSEDSMAQISDINADGKITFENMTDEIQQIEAGDIIVSGASTNTPNGLLKRVTKVEDQTDNRIVFETEQISLEEAIESTSFQYTNRLKPSDIDTPVLADGLALVESNHDDELRFQINHLVIYDEDENAATTNDQIVANGEVLMKVDFDLDLEINDFELDYFKFATTIEESAEITLTSDIDLQKVDRKKLIGSPINFSPITIDLPAQSLSIPVVIQPKLSVSIGLDGDVSIEFEAGTTHTASTTGGLEYINGEWRQIKSNNSSLEFTPPQFTASASLKPYVESQLAILVYGSDGPWADVDIYTKWKAETTPDYYWSLHGGIEFGIGAGVHIFSKTLANYEVPALIEEEFLVSEYLPPQSPSNPIPQHKAEDQEIDLALTWMSNEAVEPVFDVYLEAENENPTLLICENIQITTCQAGDLAYETAYYWKVVVKHQNGDSTSGPIWQFSTQVESTGPLQNSFTLNVQDELTADVNKRTYTFVAETNQRFYFEDLSTSADNGIKWTLYDPNGRRDFIDRFEGERDPGSLILRIAGEYTIEVSASAGVVGSYKFAVRSIQPETFQINFGDVVKDGQPSSGAGNIENPGNRNRYTFTTTEAGQRVYFDDLNNSPTSNLVYWGVYDPNGVKIFEDSLHNNDPGVYILDLAGEYTIDTWGETGIEGSYSFSVRSNPPDSFSINFGDVIGTDQPGPGAGVIELPGDRNRYTFTAAANQRVYFEDMTASIDDSLSWALYDPNGQTIFSDTFNGDDPGVVTLDLAGEYTIYTWAQNNTKGTYAFGLRSNAPEEFEISVGDVITNGQPAIGAGHIELTGDQNRYTFNAVSGQQLYFNDMDSESGSRIRWALYDPNGVELFSDKFNTSDPGAFTIDLTGKYTIMTWADNNFKGTYAFSVRHNPPESFAINIGDVVEQGQAPIGGGRLEGPGDRNRYTFNASAGQQVYFDDMLSRYNYGKIINWSLYDPNGVELFSDIFDNNDPGFYTLDLTGEYTIDTWGDSDDYGAYAFSFRSDPIEEFEISIGDMVQDGKPALGAGNIEGVGKRNRYTFTASAGQQVYFEDLSGSRWWMRWALYDPNGVELFSDIFDNKDPGLYTLDLAGEYTIDTRANSNDYGTYAFALRSNPPEEIEINIGDVVQNGQPISGAGIIEIPGSSNFYTFKASAGQRVYFDDMGASTNMIRWALYDPNGTQLFRDLFNSYNPNVYELEQAGEYKIITWAMFDHTGTYTFSVRSNPADAFTINIGDTIENGQPASGAGNIELPGDLNQYTFNAVAGQQVYFDDMNASVNNLIYWALYDPNGIQLFSDTLDSFDPGTFTLDLAGEYTILTQADNRTTGTYSFSMRSIPPDSFDISFGDVIKNGQPGTGAGNIEQPGNQNRYTFNASVGHRVYFDDMDASASNSIKWTIYDPNGAQLFTDTFDNKDPGVYILNLAGEYTVLTWANHNIDGTYAFSIRSNPPESFAINIGDMVQDGQPAIGAGNIELPGNQNRYTFNAIAGQRVYFDDMGGSISNAIRWELYDPNGRFRFSDALNDRDPGVYTLDLSGEYTIITWADNNVEGTYSFSIYLEE